MKLDIYDLYRQYFQFKSNIISNRVFKNSDLKKEINKYKINKKYNISIIGYSIQKREIYKISWGIGNIKILVWSQMHGDESTGTFAMLDVINFFNLKNLLSNYLYKKLTIYYIPILNPDGAENFQRRNYIGVDLNRDALSLVSPEMKILFNEIKKIKPNFLLNLHDQKSIYNVGNTKEPSVISFLSPSVDYNKSITNTRKITMSIISFIEKEMQKIIPGKISRYSDEFYPTATGDNIHKLGYPCLLIEAGYFSNDKYKIKSRKYIYLSIISFFHIVTSLSKIEFCNSYNSYFSIPNNNKLLFDKIYQNIIIIINNNKYKIDIGLSYREIYNQNTQKLDFLYEIIDIGDLSFFFGRKEINFNEKYFFIGKKGNTYPKIGDYENFFELKKI